MGPEPTPPTPTPPDEGAGIARQAGIVVVVFAATLILLLGAGSLLTTDPQPSGSVAASRSAAPSKATPSASGAASGSQGAGAPGSGGPSGTAGASEAPGATASGSASPTPAPSGNQVLVGAGDIADCATDDDAATARLLDQLPGTVFTAGDNALPDGSAGRFADCYAPTWGRHLARTRPAPGERDWATKDLAGYLGYFGAAAAPDGVTWYSYDLGWWHVVVLDSACAKVGGCIADSDQGRWLAKDLAASKATCTLAIWHRPLASSGADGGDPEVAPFWQALYAAHAEVIVNAHDRDYERFAPQDPGGREDRAHGIRQFVAGTGGAPLGGFGPSAANSEFRLAGAHGVLRLVLREKDYAWTFVPSDGTATDSGQAACH
jgi:hypothetical protein